MKDLGNKAISYLHYLILVWGCYTTYVIWDEHEVQTEQLTLESAQMDEEIARTKTKVSEIQDFVKKADEYKIRVAEVTKNIEAVQKQLPSEINDTQILGFFSEEMSLLNIKDPSLTPATSEETGTYFISKDFSLKAKGTFLQFLVFFERLSNASRIFNIKEFKLTIATDALKGRFQMVNGEGIIQAFRYNPNFKSDKGLMNDENNIP